MMGRGTMDGSFGPNAMGPGMMDGNLTPDIMGAGEDVSYEQ